MSPGNSGFLESEYDDVHSEGSHFFFEGLNELKLIYSHTLTFVAYLKSEHDSEILKRISLFL